MGQQQLILLVLATVIVGIAIVVGIRAFTENSAKSNADAMMQDAVRIANDIQAWKKKPAPFGGQASLGDTVCDAACLQAEADFTGADWPLLGYTEDTNGNYVNLNGVFEIVPSDNGVIITGTNDVEGNEIVVALCGMDDDDIDGVITDLNGQGGGTAPTCGTP